MSDEPRLPAFPAAARWAAQLERWAIPETIVERAPESPWRHDPTRFRTDPTADRDALPHRWAREVLPPVGGTVLDVGCGGGRAALALVPPATEVVGVDVRGAMLDDFVEAASAAGVARRTVHGTWPDVAATTPIADVAVCHHVAYDVADLAPFLLALTDHARLAVIVVVPTRHPMSAWSAAFEHFWGLERPSGPIATDLIAVVAELGLDPEHTTCPRAPRPGEVSDPAALVHLARRRLCLPVERDDELAAWLAEHPPDWPDALAVLRWPGEAGVA